MKKVLLLLADGYETYEASVFIDVIGWNLIDGDRSTQLFSCGLKKEIISSFSQKSIVDFLIEEININDFDALAIPGGFEEYDFYKENLINEHINILDVGVNKGQSIDFFKKINQNSNIIAFEPNKKLFTLINK